MLFARCSKPFKRYFPYISILFLLYAVPYVFYFIQEGAWSYVAFLSVHYWAFAYIVASIAYILPVGYLRKVYFALLTTISGLFFLFDSFVVFQYGYANQSNLVAIIQGTNMNEIVEFFNSYFRLKHLLFLLSGLFFFVLLYLVLRKVTDMLAVSVSKFAMGLLFLGILLTALKPEVFQNNLLGKIYTLAHHEPIPSLKDYFTHPALVQVSKIKPKNVVVIFGESFAKSHSSLYGYHLKTNPRLEEFRNQGNLLVYNQVISPATNTIPSFKYMMSTYRRDMDSVWYKCTTLPEVLGMTGYHMEWISNQQAYGVWDNVITKYAELCDTVMFQNPLGLYGKMDYDGSLIDIASSRLKGVASSEYNFYFIHLMGSHPLFSSRFPKEVAVFSADDYKNTLSNQRKTLADYDNSIFYNDFVVSELINLFNDKEAILLYLSDHGYDVYESRNDYVGHADLNSPLSIEVSSQIPFMFFLTDRFRQRFPSIENQLRNGLNQPYCTEDLIYLIMKIIGYEFKDVENP